MTDHDDEQHEDGREQRTPRVDGLPAWDDLVTLEDIGERQRWRIGDAFESGVTVDDPSLARAAVEHGRAQQRVAAWLLAGLLAMAAVMGLGFVLFSDAELGIVLVLVVLTGLFVGGIPAGLYVTARRFTRRHLATFDGREVAANGSGTRGVGAHVAAGFAAIPVAYIVSRVLGLAVQFGLRLAGIEELEASEPMGLALGFGLLAAVWVACYRGLLDRMP